MGFIVVLLLALLGGLSASVSGQDVHAAGTALEEHEFVYVHQGDTLWEIASEYAPDEDIRDYIDEIKKLNGLKSSALQTGQKLLLP
ncbi:LysM peptidoglycan-binding domain-containing protein [Paenibacillus mucilaginosus]|uniref:LysM peptidoglycan-binding domain-containing protein n=1 Tax=Paenibacillus mucilaginosus TaxID=61624 RepID=UPI003D1A875A